MITLLKVNCITDDAGLPEELHVRLRELLAEYIVDDPEGPAHANITLEWRAQIQNRDYMKSLQISMGAERIAAPTPAAPVSRPARQPKKKS